MSSSWWDFAEWSGQLGDKLALYQITCPFCFESGNFELAHHLERKKPSGDKVLNYDIYKCGACGNYTMVFWTASSGPGRGMHDYRTLPWPKKIERFPKHWPEDIGRNWLQAHRSLDGENWDAAALMARSAIQLATRYHKAEGGSLKAEIDNLAAKGVLPPIMKEWSHEVRELANDAAHPTPGTAGTTPKDAKDVANFLDYLLQFLYDLPHQIEQYRSRKDAGQRSDPA